MSAKAKIIRYSLEIIILIVLIFVLRAKFMERDPIEYPGSWMKTPGPSSNTVHSLLWMENSKTLLAGSKTQDDDDGIAVYSPSKIDWTTATTPFSKTQIVMDFARSDNRIYATHFFTDGNPGKILVSENQGFEWTVLDTFPNELDPRCIDIFDSGEMIAGTVKSGIYISSDKGLTWKASNDGLDNKSVQCIEIDPKDSAGVYAGTLRGLFVSKDSGKTWRENNMGEGNFLVVDIAIHPTTGQIYLIYRDEKGLAHILRSKDNGNSWSVVMEGLPADIQPRCIAFHPGMDSSVYIGTVYDGVYRSDDNGKFWSPMNNELPLETHYIIIHDLEFSTGPDIKLYAGTDLNGAVWEYRF